jgi:PAS domain-containing protein
VADSEDACLVLDPDGAVMSISAAAAELLGCGDSGVVGRPLLDVIDVVDLETGAPNPDYADRITPLAVLTGRGLMRSLMRIRHPDDALVTVDTASAPVHDESGETLGSISFLASMASL